MSRAEYTLRAAGIAVELHGDPGRVGAALGPEQEAVLSLALREATTNVVRHSRAARCEISIDDSTRGVVMAVKDDGQGGADSERLYREGSGLRGMRERVESAGGEIEVTRENGAGSGTTVRVHLPLATNPRPARTAFVSDKTIFSGAFPDMDVQRS